VRKNLGRTSTESGPTVSSMPAAQDAPLLEVDDLEVQFFTRRGVVQAVRNVSLNVGRAETLGLVGESGSGKSVMSQSVLGLVQVPGRITGGDIRWKGRSLLGKKNKRYAKAVRGREISIIFQDPMTSLNPLLTVGTQITEVLRQHLGMSKKQANERANALLELVGISFPAERINQYPHEFSGGMRQRVMIAMALASDPDLLIADEPTTALDVTIQAQILELIADIQQRLGLAVLLITHDLGVVAGLCHRMAVMYAGKIVETGNADEIFDATGHPYTHGLLQSTPRVDVIRQRLRTIEGNPVDLLQPPSGCPYHPRCAIKSDRCAEEMPPLERHPNGREVACWRAFDQRIARGEATAG
jgi:peptide/nickel transport system ATP-binding protein